MKEQNRLKCLKKGFTWSTEPQVSLKGESKLTADQRGRHDQTVNRQDEVRERQQSPSGSNFTRSPTGGERGTGRGINY